MCFIILCGLVMMLQNYTFPLKNTNISSIFYTGARDILPFVKFSEQTRTRRETKRSIGIQIRFLDIQTKHHAILALPRKSDLPRHPCSPSDRVKLKKQEHGRQQTWHVDENGATSPGRQPSSSSHHTLRVGAEHEDGCRVRSSSLVDSILWYTP